MSRLHGMRLVVCVVVVVGLAWGCHSARRSGSREAARDGVGSASDGGVAMRSEPELAAGGAGVASEIEPRHARVARFVEEVRAAIGSETAKTGRRLAEVEARSDRLARMERGDAELAELSGEEIDARKRQLREAKSAAWDRLMELAVLEAGALRASKLLAAAGEIRARRVERAARVSAAWDGLERLAGEADRLADAGEDAAGRREVLREGRREQENTLWDELNVAEAAGKELALVRMAEAAARHARLALRLEPRALLPFGEMLSQLDVVPAGEWEDVSAIELEVEASLMARLDPLDRAALQQIVRGRDLAGREPAAAGPENGGEASESEPQIRRTREDFRRVVLEGAFQAMSDSDVGMVELVQAMVNSGYTSAVQFTTSTPGALVKYRLVTANSATTVPGATNQADVDLPIGYYYVWAERDGQPSSSPDERYLILDESLTIHLHESGVGGSGYEP